MKLKKMNDEEKIKKILDNDYFHICYVYENNGKETWKIYFKNMSEEEYFSNKNTALLNSSDNTIEDIYALKECFEKQKENVLIQHISEYISQSLEIFSFGNHFILETHTTFAWVELAIVMATIISSFFKNILGGLIETLVFINLVIIELVVDRIMTKNLNERIKEHKEKFIKKKIYEEGLVLLIKFYQTRKD